MNAGVIPFGYDPRLYLLQNSPYLQQAQGLGSILQLARAAAQSNPNSIYGSFYLPMMNMALQQAGVPKSALSWDGDHATGGGTQYLAYNLGMLPAIMDAARRADSSEAAAQSMYNTQKSAYDHDLSKDWEEQGPDGKWRVVPAALPPDPMARHIFGNPTARAAVDALPPWQRASVYGGMTHDTTTHQYGPASGNL